MVFYRFPRTKKIKIVVIAVIFTSHPPQGQIALIVGSERMYVRCSGLMMLLLQLVELMQAMYLFEAMMSHLLEGGTFTTHDNKDRA